MTHVVRAIVVTSALAAAVPVAAQDVGFANAWPGLSPAQRNDVQSFAEDFKTFLGQAKSEMAFVRRATAFAEANGFRRWDTEAAAQTLTPGSRWYAVNRDRTIVLFVIGTEPLEPDLRIVNSHIDSPRIEFKTKPFRESQQAVLIDHAGARRHQELPVANVPLAVTGRVDKADGTTVWVDMGNALGDPVLLYVVN